MGAFAPPGVMPALAQAIVNGSLWTNPELYKWAVFIGLPTPDPELQACVTSYFHTTYTPVTTSTTTTSTATTTTVTVTKPVISATLIAGIAAIVIVIAAVVAVIALRRR